MNKHNIRLKDKQHRLNKDISKNVNDADDDDITKHN